MKRFSWVGLVALLASLLAGCRSSPYSIINRQEGRAVKAVEVQVRATATASEMAAWSQEIEAQEKVAGKQFLVNFYNGDKSLSTLRGTYLNGHLATVPSVNP